MDSEELKIISLVSSDIISKSDAIICLEGDGQERTKRALEIFKQGFAPVIIVSGGYDNPPFSIIASKMADYLLGQGVKKSEIIVEQISQNTRGQALEVMKMAKEKKWEKLILVASIFHQPRAYLTFLKAMDELGLKILIINASVENQHPSQELLDLEFKKIKEYGEKGHVFTFNQVFEYQKWKEQQI